MKLIIKYSSELKNLAKIFSTKISKKTEKIVKTSPDFKENKDLKLIKNTSEKTSVVLKKLKQDTIKLIKKNILKAISFGVVIRVNYGHLNNVSSLGFLKEWKLIRRVFLTTIFFYKISL